MCVCVCLNEYMHIGVYACVYICMPDVHFFTIPCWQMVAYWLDVGTRCQLLVFTWWEVVPCRMSWIYQSRDVAQPQ